MPPTSPEPKLVPAVALPLKLVELFEPIPVVIPDPIPEGLAPLGLPSCCGPNKPVVVAPRAWADAVEANPRATKTAIASDSDRMVDMMG